MPDIQKAYDAHKQEIQFIAVNMDQKKDDGVAFWRDGKYTIPMYQPNIQKVSVTIAFREYLCPFS